jgi:CDP-diacylglycerol pyrophosphatase
MRRQKRTCARSKTMFLAVAALCLGFAGRGHAADPEALWKIVHDKCVPNEERHGNPTPCALVDLRGGGPGGYIVLKDLVGATQYLLIPTARLAGIESAALLAPDAPNYFADAWRQRGYTERAAGHALPRAAISLAINSALGRSQSQFHIHIDCIRSDVEGALRRQQPMLGGRWTALAEPLAGHHYRALRVLGAELDGTNPFARLAEGVPGARAAMGEQTLVVVGAEFGIGQPGFIILDDRADRATGDRASGEELQDHGCALARS